MSTTTLFGDTAKLDEEYDTNARIVLYPGDVLSLLATVPDETIKLIVTSPPYNIGKAYESRVGIEQYLNLQKGVISELHRVLSSNGSICWQVGNYVDKGEIFPLDVFYNTFAKKAVKKSRQKKSERVGYGF